MATVTRGHYDKTSGQVTCRASQVAGPLAGPMAGSGQVAGPELVAGRGRAAGTKWPGLAGRRAPSGRAWPGCGVGRATCPATLQHLPVEGEGWTHD